MLTAKQLATQNENKKIAKGYIRVSTIMQKEEGVSLETQSSRIQEYCTYKKLDLIKVYQDAGISGKNMTDRPGIQEVIAELQKGENIIFTELSRLGRNTMDVITFNGLVQEKGANLICLSPDIDFSTPLGELVMTVLASFNQYERKMIAKNISINMQRLVADGKLRGKSPFGYKFVGKDKDLEPVEEQQEVIEFVLMWYGQSWNLTKIANELNNAGYGPTLNLNKAKVTNLNPKFYAETVRRILADYGQIDRLQGKPIEQKIVSHHKIT
jgi:site-specific DNA recombinase